MKKINLYICILLLLLVFFGGCSVSRENNEVIDVALDEYSKELDGFLPKGDFKWIYTGFAEYMQELTIMDVYETSAKKTYKTSGEVLDMSSGESSLDFSLAVNYIITHDELIQEKIEEVMMDSEFDKLILLKLPIEVNATWSENVTSSDGEKESITATIVEIIGKKPNRTVRVEYVSSDAKYMEKRSIQEGLGVVSFDKSMNFGSDKFDMGYSLMKYKLEKANADTDSEANISKDLSTDDKLNNKVDDPNLVEKELVNQLSDEEKAVKEAIVNFNNSWLSYINDDDNSIYDYLLPNGKAYKIIKNFKKGNMKQKFNVMDVQEVSIDGSEANVNVHEEIVKLIDNNSTTLVYDWIYHLKKLDDKWLIDYYEGAN